MTETQKPLIEKTWDEELAVIEQTPENFEKKEALKLESGKITKFTIDLSTTVKEWTAEDGTLKKIIPVLFKGEKRVIFLNVKNPLYAQIKDKIRNKQLDIAVSTTGTAKQTRYAIVEEA